MSEILYRNGEWVTDAPPWQWSQVVAKLSAMPKLPTTIGGHFPAKRQPKVVAKPPPSPRIRRARQPAPVAAAPPRATPRQPPLTVFIARCGQCGTSQIFRLAGSLCGRTLVCGCCGFESAFGSAP